MSGIGHRAASNVFAPFLRERIDQMPLTEITGMTFGPYAVARLDGKTVMTPNASPGDLVEIEIASDRREYAIGRIGRIVRAGADRRVAPCPYLPRCGGCDWQQIEYAAQVRLKSKLIAAEFDRALGVRLNPEGLVEPAPEEFGYRARIRLQTRSGGRIGFHELGGHSLVEIDRCLVAAPELAIPATIRDLARRCAEIEIAVGISGKVLVAHMAKAPRRDDIVNARKLVDSGEIAGIVVRGSGRREVIGDARVAIEAESGCTIEAEADLFSQVNRAQNRKLVAAVMDMVGVAPGRRVLDLFCGTGNFSLPAARRGADVTGADADVATIEAARRNAARMELNEARFVAMSAANAAAFFVRAGYRPELVILDPPRTGAAELMEPIGRMAPREVIYVSCDPPTLVRDLRILVGCGYRVDFVRAFDFFPNTHHVEVAVRSLLT
ncbi:MAG TPA: class I SAM-dependent RNA methyltransferase [Candidatus Binataceae bacterium]|nr:class I SAM-dependent RNA methyltransferase [Candidatus Binataceae bacterium]